MENPNNTEEVAERLQDLGAYLDDEIADPQERERIGSNIMGCEHATRLLRELRSQKDNLQRLAFFDALESYGGKRRHRQSWTLQRAAASILIIAGATTAGWYGGKIYSNLEFVQFTAFADKSAEAYGVVTASLATADASPTDVSPAEVSPAELTALQSFIQRYFGAETGVPLTIGADFKLEAMQIVADDAGPALQASYRNGEGRIILLRISGAVEGPASSKFSWTVRDGVRICYWRSDRARFALSGELSRADMLTLAKTVTSLTPKLGPAI